MAHNPGNNTEPSIFNGRVKWQQAKEPALKRMWIYAPKDTRHWKKN
jgi:hypothetical protein